MNEDKLIACLCSYKSLKGIIMAGNNNVYKSLWKKGAKNIMKNKSTNDLSSIFMGNTHFKKLIKFKKIIETFDCCLTRVRNKVSFNM